jgi:hypothetical protein
MKRIIAAILATLLFAVSVQAKVLVIVANSPAVYLGSDNSYINNIFARWQKILGFEYDTYDANYLRVKAGSGLYTHHGVAGSDSQDVWDIANSGDYSCAILLNLSTYVATTALDEASEFIATGWGTSRSNLGEWANRASVHASPIPLILPAPTYFLVTSGKAWDTAITGQIAGKTRSWAATHDRGVVDAQGDSIFTGVQPTNLYEAFVVGSDSLSWVRRLVWRDDDALYDTQSAKPTYLWMTVGTGNHKVVYFPYCANQYNAYLWPTVIGMFEKITPIDVPIVAEYFGSASEAYWGTSEDTVSLGTNFKAIKDYAVANGMKIDLLGLTWSMKRETGAHSHPVFKTTAYTYANQYPGNIRITPSTYESWKDATHYDWLGTQNATSPIYSGMLSRMTYTQDSLAAYFPLISRTRAHVNGGVFAMATNYNKSDSVLTALAAKGIADVYDYGDGSYGAQYPSNSSYHVIGAQRTWIGRGVGIKEMRFHPLSVWRYTLQQTNDAYGDTLRISYINTAQYRDNRSDFMRYLIPVNCGYYRTTAEQAVGSQGVNIISATTTNLATHGAGYQPGIHLNALTFTGGSAAKFPLVTGVDPSRSLFLDMMKQVNGMVKMANYVVDTYGVVKQPVFVYSWMEDVKHDRRGGKTYGNNHVSKE